MWGTRTLETEVWLTPRKMLLPHMLPYQISSLTLGQKVWKYIAKIWRTLGPPWDGNVADPIEMCFTPSCCYHAKFGHSRLNHSSVIVEICHKNLTPHAPPFKVTQGHWNPPTRINQLPMTCYWCSTVTMALSWTTWTTTAPLVTCRAQNYI